MSDKFKRFYQKNILFISPAFFNYEEKIKTKLESFGANVYFFSEIYNIRNLRKILVKKIPILFKKSISTYYDSIFEEVKDIDFDYVFFIKANYITTEILSKFKEYFNSAKFILYLYDSIKNINNILNKIYYFDDVYTFDRFDAINHELRFRPLFYTDEFKNKNSNETTLKYDLSFIGTVHSDRLKIIKKFMKFNIDAYLYLYIQSRILYFVYKILKPSFWFVSMDKFKFIGLDYNTVNENIEKSNTILDIHHPKQTGLTMRTIEMIGMNKKIITTNKDIINYDFYNPNNILVIDRKKIKINLDFFKNEYQELSPNIYDNYHINSWILDVFN